MGDRTTPFDAFLGAARFAVLDGGLASALEDRGHLLDTALWSARLIIDAPESISDVHRAYLDAGADCITSASYQASLVGLRAAGLSEANAEAVLRRASELAVEARDDFWRENGAAAARPRPLVAASVGPYGASLADGSEYVGRYGVSRDRLRAFHERRLELLAASAVDLLAFETIPSLEEAGVLTELLDQHPGVQVWFSFTCRDERHLSDGSDFTDAVQLCAGHDAVVAVGVNCSDPRVVPGLIAAASEHTHRPLIAYPNSGEVYDAGRRTWMGPPAGETWMSCALATLEAGATILGGCCRVGPDTIAQLRRRADDRHWGTDPLSRDDS